MRKTFNPLVLDKVTVSGLHCKQPDKLVVFCPAVPSLSIQRPVTSAQITTVAQDATDAHEKHGSVCIVSQSARGLTRGDPPLTDFCVFFHFVSLRSS